MLKHPRPSRPIKSQWDQTCTKNAEMRPSRDQGPNDLCPFSNLRVAVPVVTTVDSEHVHNRNQQRIVLQLFPKSLSVHASFSHQPTPTNF
jgi:hypothetical protein